MDDNDFWKTHALVSPDNLTQDDDLGDENYWRKERALPIDGQGIEKIVAESVRMVLREYHNGQHKKIVRCAVKNILKEERENDLMGLLKYISKEPTSNIYQGNGYGVNLKLPAFNYFIPQGIVHNV